MVSAAIVSQNVEVVELPSLTTSLLQCLQLAPNASEAPAVTAAKPSTKKAKSVTVKQTTAPASGRILRRGGIHVPVAYRKLKRLILAEPNA
jgi:predicted transcriptional regulator